MNDESKDEIITKQEIFSQKTEKVNVNNAEIKSNKSFIILVFAIIALLILFISLILPWYGYLEIVDRHNSITGESEHSESGFGVPISRGWGREAYNGHTSLYSGDEKVPLLFLITTFLVILALISITLFIIFILNEMVQKRRSKLSKVFGVLAIIFCLLAPLVFMIALPAAMKADKSEFSRYEEGDDPTMSFFGSSESSRGGTIKTTEQKKWGGDIGWFLAWISFILILISYILFFQKEKIRQHNY